MGSGCLLLQNKTMNIWVLCFKVFKSWCTNLSGNLFQCHFHLNNPIDHSKNDTNIKTNNSTLQIT